MRNLFQNKPDFVPENRVRASYWTWRSTSKMAMRSAWSPVLSLLTCLLPTTRSTTDASSARCWRWLATYTWPTWYAPCWKTDASSWCWTGRRAVGDDNEMDYHREVYWHRCCSTSTPTTSPYTPTLAASSTQTTCASRPKETTSTTSKCHSRLPWALWPPTTTLTNCVRTLQRHRCVLST